jgi:hypothetical protein
MYKASVQTKFLTSETPFIFVNCETLEKHYGESFMNKGEAQLVVEIVKHLIHNAEACSKNDIGFVSPYQG